MYEIEAKFMVNDISALENALNSLGAPLGEPVEEYDQFYQHPSRDFSQTDEGLRIRTRTASELHELSITYKGQKIDAETKSRKEIEIPLKIYDLDLWNDLLCSLGFVPAGIVRKFRRTSRLSFDGIDYEIVLDELPDLSDPENQAFFVEIETQSDNVGIDFARDSLLKFAKTLPLAETVRKGYMELILEKTAKNS